VRRVGVVLVAAALSAGLAAALAATAGRQPATFPDPQVQARPDGCGRDYLAQTRRDIPTWVYVNDRDAPAGGPAPPPQRLQGAIGSQCSPASAISGRSATPTALSMR
jgi:hypothetical protein